MIHLRVLVSVPVLALLAASGCEKVNDVPRLRDEAVATAASYQQRFDELEHRAAAINPARLTTTEVKRIYQQAKVTLERNRNDLRQVPVQAQASATNGNAEDLQKLIDVLRERFETGVIEATSELGAVESWLTAAEQHGAPRVPAPTSPEPGNEDSTPASPSEGAPIR